MILSIRVDQDLLECRGASHSSEIEQWALLVEKLEREVWSRLGFADPEPEPVCRFSRLEATKILPIELNDAELVRQIGPTVPATLRRESELIRKLKRVWVPATLSLFHW